MCFTKKVVGVLLGKTRLSSAAYMEKSTEVLTTGKKNSIVETLRGRYDTYCRLL